MIYHDDYPIVFKWFKPSSNLMISAMIIPGFKLNFISYFVYWCMVFPKQHRMMSIVIQIDIQFPWEQCGQPNNETYHLKMVCTTHLC